MNCKIIIGKRTYILPKFKDIIFVIYLFFVIYMPPLLKNGMIDRVILIISAIYVALNISHMLSILKVHENKRILCLSFVLLMYSLIISISNSILNNDSGDYFGKPIEILVFIIYFFTIAGVITIYCVKNKIEFNRFFKLLILVGLIQAAFVCVSFFSAGVRSEFLQLIAQNASNDRVNESIIANHYTALRRNYGFADTLYDRFGFTCSILCAISFNFALYKKKWKYYLASILFVLSTLVNARSGVVLCFLAMMVSCIVFSFYNHDFRKTIKMILFFIIAFIILMMVLNSLKIYAPDTYEWISEGLGMFLGNSDQISDNNEMSYFFSADFWIFPEFPEAIFGTAQDPFYVLGYSTDNGYMEQIWNIGIIGLIINIVLFIGSIWHTLKNSIIDMEKGILYAMMIVILVYSIKLSAFKNIGGTYIILSSCFFLNVLHEKKKNKKDN